MKVKNKVVLVTGGGSGMGRALVLHLLEKGAKVIAVDMNESALEQTTVLAEALSSNLKTVVLNITDKNAVERLSAEAKLFFGPVDAIINNAGIIQPFIKLNELDYDDIERVIKVNLYGTLYMTKAFLPRLLVRPEGHIVNISSMGGFLPVPGQTIYGATKAAVKLLTEGLHTELKNTNVRVSVVFPGAIHTNIMGNSGLDTDDKPLSKSQLARMTTPSKAAEIIIEGMENNCFRIMVGKDSKFLDFYYRFNPESAAAFIGRKMKRV